MPGLEQALSDNGAPPTLVASATITQLIRRARFAGCRDHFLPAFFPDSEPTAAREWGRRHGLK